ncbi:MAG: TetR/AcrR family transcriptional regulator [Methylococcales bacterium]|nr:TetR/AcrR family transcriptional regulator [Methylococcales bacterium]
MARRSEHSQEEIKQMVLNVAETIVDEEGFSELKVRKIAMEIGYTVGSIYMVFENMADLIMHVKGQTLDDIALQLQQQVNDGNAEQIIQDIATTYLSYANENINRWRMIFEHQLAENELVPDWYQRKVDTVFALVEIQFQQLSSKHDEQQSKQAARALWGGVHGVCILSLTGKLDLVGVGNIEETVVLLVENFIKGWKAD